MRFVSLFTTPCQQSFYRSFYAARPGLREKSFAEQKAAIDYQAIGWSDFWRAALGPLGYECTEIYAGMKPLQRKWAEETVARFPPGSWETAVALQQVRAFGADVLFMEDSEIFTRRWFDELRSSCPSLRLILGVAGSSVRKTASFYHADIILSSAHEAVDLLRGKGLRAEQLHYAFDPRVAERITPGTRQKEVSFLGQIVPQPNYHASREQLLEQLVDRLPLSIYTTSFQLRLADHFGYVLRQTLYDCYHGAGVPETTLEGVPVLGKPARWESRPVRPVSPKLRPHLLPPLFGLEMFQALASSKIVLNIHADSSPLYASNYRLFEATGVGACLLTDWRSNLPDLFSPDAEIATYRSPEECLEKARWLLDHESERMKIAEAGRRRCLRDHTFAKRAEALDSIIQRFFAS